MPAIPCKGCGGTTNTACSDHLNGERADIGRAACVCYAAWDEKTNRWVKGCGYDTADPIEQYLANHLINRK